MLIKVKFRETQQKIGVSFQNSNQHIQIGFSQIQLVKEFGEAYEGDHIITPSRAEQIMPTKNKQMTDNVTVEAIPFYEVGNNSHGTTFIIGE